MIKTGGNGDNDDDNDAMVICKLSHVLVDGGDGDNDNIVIAMIMMMANGCPAHSHLSCFASKEKIPP